MYAEIFKENAQTRFVSCCFRQPSLLLMANLVSYVHNRQSSVTLISFLRCFGLVTERMFKSLDFLRWPLSTSLGHRYLEYWLCSPQPRRLATAEPIVSESCCPQNNIPQVSALSYGLKSPCRRHAVQICYTFPQRTQYTVSPFQPRWARLSQQKLPTSNRLGFTSQAWVIPTITISTSNG